MMQKEQQTKIRFDFIETTMDWNIVKILLSLFMLILIPAYWRHYGPQNFLWLSDVGLFLTILALWTNWDWLMSVAAVGMLLLELIWCLDFLNILIFKTTTIKLADYMFDPIYSFPLRLLSLFHIIMPIIWIFYLREHGYNPMAIYYAIGLFWIILLLSYLFTDPEKNINWVFLPKVRNIKIWPIAWVVIVAICFPLLFFLPVHYLFLELFNVKY